RISSARRWADEPSSHMLPRALATELRMIQSATRVFILLLIGARLLVILITALAWHSRFRFAPLPDFRDPLDCGPDRGGQCGAATGLFDQNKPLVHDPRRVSAVARCQHDREVRAVFTQLARKVDAAHPTRHHDIRNHQSNRAIALDYRQGCLAVRY